MKRKRFLRLCREIRRHYSPVRGWPYRKYAERARLVLGQTRFCSCFFATSFCGVSSLERMSRTLWPPATKQVQQRNGPGSPCRMGIEYMWWSVGVSYHSCRGRGRRGSLKCANDKESEEEKKTTGGYSYPNSFFFQEAPPNGHILPNGSHNRRQILELGLPYFGFRGRVCLSLSPRLSF